MCRNIRTLHNFDPPASDQEIREAALQYVRKISGYTKPSRANAEAFEQAIDEVEAASTKLLDRLVTSAPPKDREVEAAKRRARRRAALRGLTGRRYADRVSSGLWVGAAEGPADHRDDDEGDEKSGQYVVAMGHCTDLLLVTKVILAPSGGPRRGKGVRVA